MSEQERRNQFIRVMQEAEHRFGMTVVASVQPEMLGQVLQVRTVISVAPIANWTPAQPAQEEVLRLVVAPNGVDQAERAS